MTAPLLAVDSVARRSSPGEGLGAAELTTRCAWCGVHLFGPRRTVADGVEYEVSHGICAECRDRMEVGLEETR